MNVLITGARGFVGKNLTQALDNIMTGKDRTRPGINIDRLYLYDVGDDAEKLGAYCADCSFVFHLAGVNRPKDEKEFTTGNTDLTARLLSLLREHGNACPVMISSSVQASQTGRYEGSAYGKSKAEAEKLVFAHAKATGAPALVYRLPNLFGKWSRPDYNSVIATFCHRIARDEPITVNDPATRLELLYIDDLIGTLLDALEGKVAHCRACGSENVPDENGEYCFAPGAHSVTLGEIADALHSFRSLPRDIMMPEIPDGSFTKKLYSTYLSFLPPEDAAFPLNVHADERGSFTELLKTANCGQFSVNVSEPGITKGDHWHNSKWELFIVVSGEALIRQRKVGEDKVTEYRVSGDKPTAVRMLPGYTHSIVNLSETQKLITLMWANERFDPSRPDTFRDPV